VLLRACCRVRSAGCMPLSATWLVPAVGSCLFLLLTAAAAVVLVELDMPFTRHCVLLNVDYCSGPDRAVGTVCVCLCVRTLNFEVKTLDLNIWHHGPSVSVLSWSGLRE